MSNYEDRVWCDVLDIDIAYILLGRLWLYDLDVTSLGRSNTYEFKFNGKKIVLKPVKPPKSNVGNNEGTFTAKDNNTPYHLVTRSYFPPESLIDGSTLGLGIPSAFSLFPQVSHQLSLLSHLHYICMSCMIIIQSK